MAVISPLTGTPLWSGVAPTSLADSQGVSQPVKPALVHCLEVARGYCEAELSPAPPGTPRRGPAPKGERKLRGLELRVRVRGTWPVFPAGDGGGTCLRRGASHCLLPPPPCASQLRPDPLRYCQLKPSSGQGAGGREQPGAPPPLQPSQLGAVRSVPPASLTQSFPPSRASAGVFHFHPGTQGSGSGIRGLRSAALRSGREHLRESRLPSPGAQGCSGRS